MVFVGLLTIVNWAGRLASGPPPKNAAYDWNVAIGSVIQFAFMLLVIALIARGAWDLLALRRPRRWLAALGTGIAILVVVNVVTVALEPVLHAGREQGLTPSRWEPSHAAAFAVFAFAVVVLAPVTEELAFRGLGYGLLNALVVITILGIGLAWLRYRQGSTIPGIILHGAFNGIALAASLLT